MRRVSRAVSICCVLLAGPLLLAAAPATQPQSRQNIEQWVDQLAARDPAARESARVALMALSRDELPGLRAIIARRRPLLPSQAAPMHDIVVQAYLASESYTTAEDQAGFLGLRWRGLDAPDTEGQPVEELIPGFAAAAVLREGDLIVAVVEYPELDVRNRAAFTEVIKKTAPGTRLHFDVVRQGQTLRLPIKLDARPLVGMSEAEIGAFFNERLRKAEAYWTSNFAPLVDEVLS
jgi:hypothetical protein